MPSGKPVRSLWQVMWREHQGREQQESTYFVCCAPLVHKEKRQEVALPASRNFNTGERYFAWSESM
jgi:hypothetical protein